MIVLVYACTIHKLGPGVDVNGSDIKGLDLIIFLILVLLSHSFSQHRIESGTVL